MNYRGIHALPGTLALSFAIALFWLTGAAHAAANPCAMFTAADVSRALGKPATGPTLDRIPDGEVHCSFAFGGGSLVIASVHQSTSTAAASAELKSEMKLQEEGMGGTPSALPNTGDEAFILRGTVYVRRGTRVASIAVAEFPPSQALTDAKAVAKMARP